MIKKNIDRYAKLVSRRPFAFLLILSILTATLAYGATNVETVEQNTEDLLPDTIESVNAFEVISAEFGQGSGGASYTVLFETAPEHANSTEIRDVRDPEFINYLKTVSSDISQMKEVVSVSSVSDLVDDPVTKRDVSYQLQNSPISSQYVSEDYSFTIMRITATDLSQDQQQELAERIQTAVKVDGKPSGIKTSYTGQPFINQAFMEQTDSTMSTTSLISLIGVLLVVVLLFRSITSGLTSLLALIFGVVTGFGVYGWLGLNMSPATSGAISMGMGIAIDFGIQTVSRYREERKMKDITEAMKETLNGVIRPMSVALVAAIIGFTSLSFGRITFLSDMGTMLTFTTLFAYIGALTVIPVALVLHDRYGSKIMLKVKQK